MSNSDFTNFYPSLEVMPLGFGENIDHESLNERYGQISRHINSLSFDLYSVIRNNPNYLGKYMEHNCDPFYYKKIKVKNARSFVFDDFFNIDGSRNIYAGWHVFTFPDTYIATAQSIMAAVFYQTKTDTKTSKLPEDCYIAEVRLNTLRIYVNPVKFQLPNDSTVHIVVFKAAQDFGPHIYSESTVSENFQKMVQIKINTDIETVWSKRYLTAYVRYANGTGYHPIPSDYIEDYFTNERGELCCRITRKDNYDVEHASYIVLNTLEPFYYSANIQRSGSNVTFLANNNGLGVNSAQFSTTQLRDLNIATTSGVRIPLIKKVVNGVNIPAAFSSEKDFYVFVGSEKLLPGEDYELSYNARYGAYLQITKNFGDITQQSVNITIIKNTPFVDPCQYLKITNFDQYGNADTNRLVGVLNKYSTFAFCDRRFVEPGQIKYILDNKTNFSFITAPLLEIMAYLVLDDKTIEVLNLYLQTKLDFENILDFLDQDDYDRAIQQWIDKNQLPVLPLAPVTEWPVLTKPVITKLDAPSWFMAGIQGSITIAATNAARVRWIHDGGALVTLTDSTSWTVKITPQHDPRMRYAFIRVFISTAAGVTITKRIQINIFTVNLDPTVPANILPGTLSRGSSFNIDVRTATDNDGSLINGFNIFVNNGATVTNKTQFTCTVNTNGVTGPNVKCILEIFDKEYSDNFLAGLPYAGLGYDLQVGSNNSVGGEDGFVTVVKDIVMV